MILPLPVIYIIESTFHTVNVACIGCLMNNEPVSHELHLERELDILQSVMNGAKNSHLVYLDCDFNFVRVNETYAKTCGYRPDEMVGKNHFVLYPHAENEAIFCRVRDTGEPAEFYDKPFEYPDKPHLGITYWDWTLTPVKNRDGRVTGLVFALIETTARKRTEEQLKELSQRLNHHLNASPLAVIEWGPEMRIIRWSGAAEQIFGWKAEEVLGKRSEDFNLVYEQDEAQVAIITSELQNGKNPHRFSANRNHRKNGSIINCEWYNSALRDPSGSVRSVLSLVLDVTDRVKLEKSLQQHSAKLETMVAQRTAELRDKDRLLLHQNRMAAMGEMISSIAHQWRQPLNTLGLHIQSLALFQNSENYKEQFLDPTIKDAMNLIQHMSQTIDDFRNFFKPDKDMVVFCIKTAIQNAIALVHESFSHNRIQVITNLDDDLWIKGYPNEFSQALLNILQNARDAFAGCNITNGVVTISSIIENGKVTITISDNAGGIPEDVISKIFEPYFSTKGTQGTGIGLYMARSIIETNMGGRITARNQTDGAEFSIVVPLATPPIRTPS